MVGEDRGLRAALCARRRTLRRAGVRRLRAARAGDDGGLRSGRAGTERARGRVGGSLSFPALYPRAAHLCRGGAHLHGEQRLFRPQGLPKARVFAAFDSGVDVLGRIRLRPARRCGRGGELPHRAAARLSRDDERPRAARAGREGTALCPAPHPAGRADVRRLV